MNEIERDLRRNIEDALLILAPKFRIDDLGNFPEPDIIVYGGRTQYNIQENRFEFNEERALIPVVIGEEVSHYLHLQLNPIHKTNNGPFGALRRVTLIETLGRYGGLVYLKEKGMEIMPEAEIKRSRFSYPTYDDQFDFEDDFGHRYGYKVAYKLMDLHGDSMLPPLSRMSVDDALKAIQRLAPLAWWDKKIIPLIDRVTRYKPNLELP